MSQASNSENNNFTKECIYEALWDLMRVTPYESITVTQIAKKAGVSRNAIYRNFESKEMIIKTRLKEIYDDFVVLLKNSTYKSYKEYALLVFQHLCSKKEVAEVLINANLSEYILESFFYIKGKFTTTVQSEYYENYRIGGTLFVYLTWLLTGCKETPQQLTDIVTQIYTTQIVLPNFQNP